ncbi:MAG: DUF6165 family protein [Halobacteriovoraceae bacterium]|nr:DUF6165 family protein [Halobacteriovoraceae bacterium]
MKVQVSVSLGELIDKITILKIKQEKIGDTEKLKHVRNELTSLQATLDSLGLDGYQALETQLIETNTKLWEIEDDIREKERNKDFGEGFIQLARAVYITNDQRFELKSQLNGKFGSQFQEVKSYESYD